MNHTFRKYPSAARARASLYYLILRWAKLRLGSSRTLAEVGRVVVVLSEDSNGNHRLWNHPQAKCCKMPLQRTRPNSANLNCY